MLTGQTILTIVYDNDISINYDPLEGNLPGEHLNVVAFEVLNVTERTDVSDSVLPAVYIRVLDYAEVKVLELNLHLNLKI